MLYFHVEVHTKPFYFSGYQMVCVLHFDGASKGNPGKSGAGAVLMTEDGRVISRLREGLGIVTNNVAEYRGLILGLKYAIRHGFKRIKVYGDSQLICYQVKGTWQAKKENMMELCKEVRKLQENFISFEVNHVRRVLYILSLLVHYWLNNYNELLV
jgi:ribonuclease HI